MGPPIITAGQSFTAYKREAFSRSIGLNDATKRTATLWSILAGALPAGLSFNSATGSISGTPGGLAGIYSVTVLASGPGGESSPSEIAIEVASREIETVVRLRVVPTASGVPTGPQNEVRLRGGVYAFARWTRRGSIPAGLNWAADAEGLRFWGTPLMAGTSEAEFEGPFPENFRSDLTQGGAWDDAALLAGSTTDEGIGAERFYVIFELVEVAASMRTFGEVLGQLGAETSLRARRSSWAESLQIGFLPVQPVIGNSAAPVQAGASVASNEEFSLADLLASDWQLTATAQPPALKNCLLTTQEVVQTIARATDSRAAIFLGSEIDGRTRRVILNTKIPLAPSANFLFGEFHLAAGFSGRVNVRLWITRDGEEAEVSECYFGLKLWETAHAVGHESYRLPGSPNPNYNLECGGESLPVATAEIDTFARYGIFNLWTGDLPPGITVAHVIITATRVP